MTAGRFVVPVELLAAHPEESVDLLRLGALANAITSVVSGAATSQATGVGRDRDTLQATLLVASYMKEAVDALDRRWFWDLIESAAAAGYVLQHPVAYYRRLFSRKDGSLYKRMLVELRRTKGFHVDRQHFEKWLAAAMAPEITIWQRDSDSLVDSAFTISIQIQSFYGQQLEGGRAAALDLSNAVHLGRVVEAAFVGLLVRSGHDPRAAWRRSSRGAVRIEYWSPAGVSTGEESREVEIEGGRYLSGNAMHSLADYLSRRFGVMSDRRGVGWVMNLRMEASCCSGHRKAPRECFWTALSAKPIAPSTTRIL